MVKKLCVLHVLCGEFYLSFALNANAYIRICFTIDSKPLLRVGDRCSFNPILSINKEVCIQDFIRSMS